MERFVATAPDESAVADVRHGWSTIPKKGARPNKAAAFGNQPSCFDAGGSFLFHM
jgi:hypothetical protein